MTDQADAYRLVVRVRKQIVPWSLSPTKAKLAWIEGILLSTMGIARLAALRLRKARRGLLSLAKARDYAMVSLDLARVLRLNGELEAERAVAEETRTELANLDTVDCDDLFTALSPWPDETLPVEALEQRKLSLLEPQLCRHWLWGQGPRVVGQIHQDA